ncbi:MAG: acyl-CoA dehydrogenase [Gemmatimonadetes bacterium]|nr:MAG: acyl-CoA dehydrogenase [Gemmatimonadota bacterium]
MHFSFTEQQQEVQNFARDFGRKHIAPYSREWDLQGSFPRELLLQMGDLGLLGVPIPETYGGMGLDYLSEALVFEEIGYCDSSVRTTLSVQMSLVELTILAWGTEEQKQHFLPKLCSGEWVGCFGLTEPDAGSDPANQQTIARRDGNDWILNGQKVWISNGNWADVAIIFAQTEPGSRHKGMVAFLIETAGRDGYEAPLMGNKLGLKASNTSEIFMSDLRVSDSERLGEVGEGFKVAMSALDNGRMGVAAGCVGAAQHALDVSVQYAQERQTFNKPIASRQLVQAMLADMYTETEAARMLVYKAAWTKNQGLESTIPVSMAKYYASEVAKKVADMAIQIHGGYGYSNEYDPERIWRDARVASLYEGTSQIQQLILGRHLTGISAFV